MALFYLIRHGHTDYTPCDERGYIGHGRDLASLSERGIQEAESTAKDSRLLNAEIIIASPYTRALQTAAIISKVTGIKLLVETDFHEWMPDITYQYKRFEECLTLNDEFNRFKGMYPEGENKRWESLPSLRERVRRAADKYAYCNKAIIVSHGMVMRTLTYAEEIKNGEIIECHYEIGQPDCEYSFS